MTSTSPAEQEKVAFRTLVKEISFLSPKLPETVSLGHRRDQITKVFARAALNAEDSPWQKFNQIMDSLFAEDRHCRDDSGRLANVRRGQLGMGMVADYLEALSPAEVAEIPAEVANIKLRRLCDELNELVSVITFISHIRSKHLQNNGYRPAKAKVMGSKEKRAEKPTTKSKPVAKKTVTKATGTGKC